MGQREAAVFETGVCQASVSDLPGDLDPHSLSLMLLPVVPCLPGPG